MRFEKPTYVGSAYGKKIYVLLHSVFEISSRGLVNYCFNDFVFSYKGEGIARIDLPMKQVNHLNISEGAYESMLRWAKWETRSLDGICAEIENNIKGNVYL